jgi:hypothetical protein
MYPTPHRLLSLIIICMGCLEVYRIHPVVADGDRDKVA